MQHLGTKWLIKCCRQTEHECWKKEAKKKQSFLVQLQSAVQQEKGVMVLETFFFLVPAYNYGFCKNQTKNITQKWNKNNFKISRTTWKTSATATAATSTNNFSNKNYNTNMRTSANLNGQQCHPPLTGQSHHQHHEHHHHLSQQHHYQLLTNITNNFM